MLTTHQCRRILGNAAKDMTDQEVEALRDMLYMIGYTDYRQFTEAKKKDENRSDIHPCEHGRTSEERTEP